MAARFWVGPAGNYSSTNWSTTSGGGSGSAAPTSSDDVTFDGAGANGNTNCTCTASASSNAKTLTFTTGYTATITINSNIVLTVAGDFTDQTQHTWTMGNASSNLTINAASTITSNGKTFPGTVQLTNSNTKVISGDWTVSGLVTTGSNLTLNGNTLNCGNGITHATISGTALINLTGGTWTSTGAGSISNSLTIAGNVTVSGTVNYNTGTLTYSSGTVTTTSSILNLTGTSVTLNTNGITWETVQFAPSGTQTVTINSLLSASTLLFNTNQSITFAGTSGWTCATLNNTQTAAFTITLVNGVTYTITASFQSWTVRVGTITTYTSDHATNKAILTLNAGAVCSVIASATRIDSSAGRTINTFHGTLTTTLNWYSYTDYGGGTAGSYVWT